MSQKWKDIGFIFPIIVGVLLFLTGLDVGGDLGIFFYAFSILLFSHSCFYTAIFIYKKMAFILKKKAYKKFKPVNINKLKATCGSCANTGIYETDRGNYEQVFWNEEYPKRVARVKFNNKSGRIEWVVYNDGKLVNSGIRESFTLEAYEVLFLNLRSFTRGSRTTLKWLKSNNSLFSFPRNINTED